MAIPLTCAPRRAQARALVRAGAGRLSTALSVTDTYGTQRATVTQTVSVPRS